MDEGNQVETQGQNVRVGEGGGYRRSDSSEGPTPFSGLDVLRSEQASRSSGRIVTVVVVLALMVFALMAVVAYLFGRGEGWGGVKYPAYVESLAVGRNAERPVERSEMAIFEEAVARPSTSRVVNVSEAPAERPVTNVVERPFGVDVIVERPVTNLIERLVVVEKVVERPVTNLIERAVVVEQVVDLPVTNVVVRPYELVVEYPVTNVVIKPQVVVVDFPVTNVVVQPYQVVVECPVTNEVLHPYEVVVDRPVTNYVVRDYAVLIEQVVTNTVRRETVVESPEPRTAVRAEPSPQVVTVQPVRVEPIRSVTAGQIRRPIRLTTPYTVRPGDTIGGLAYRYGFRLPDFKVYNPNVDVERIFAGQRILLPGDYPVEGGRQEVR